MAENCTSLIIIEYIKPITYDVEFIKNDIYNVEYIKPSILCQQ